MSHPAIDEAKKLLQELEDHHTAGRHEEAGAVLGKIHHIFAPLEDELVKSIRAARTADQSKGKP